MASSSIFIFLSLCAASHSLLLPLSKDPSTLQYLAHTLLGPLVLDLAGPSLWLDCKSNRPIPSSSIQCITAHGNDNNSVCDLSIQNTITGSTATGALTVGSMATVDHFLFSCAPTTLLRGLASGARGMMGLGRTRIALPSQLTGSRRRFALCLSSTNGLLISGNKRNILNSLTYTPLVAGPQNKQGYFLTVNYIKINGERVSLGASLKAEISTVVPFTKLESSVLATFVKAFAMAGASMNMSRVAAVAPFEACYTWGGAAPEIDLVLQSSMVRWRVGGRNSMVRVSEEVMCLGFVDGGPDMEVPMVLGGYQLEDVLLQFDLGTSMLGFSSSLLTTETSCSQLRSEMECL